MRAPSESSEDEPVEDEPPLGYTQVTVKLGAEERSSKCESHLPVGKLIVETAGDKAAEMKGVVCASVDGLLVGLHDRLTVTDPRLSPIYKEAAEGKAVLQHSLLFVLSMAAERGFPGAACSLCIDRMDGQVFYCTMLARGARIDSTQAGLDAVSKGMAEAIEKDATFMPKVWTNAQAVAHMEERGLEMSTALLRMANNSTLPYYNCPLSETDVFKQPTDGPLVPFAHLCPAYELELCGTGFTCRPAGSAIPPIPEVLAEAYERWHEEAEMSGVRCAADISKIVLDGPARIAELVELSEAYFERRLSAVAHEVLHADGRDPAEDDESESEPVVALVVGAPFTSTAVVGRRLAHQFRIRKQGAVVLNVESFRAKGGGSIDGAAVNELVEGLLRGEDMVMPSGRMQHLFHKTTMRSSDKKKILIIHGDINTGDSWHSELPCASSAFVINTAALAQPRVTELSPIGGEIGRLVRGLVASRRSTSFNAGEFLGKWTDEHEAAPADSIVPLVVSNARVVLNTLLPHELSVLRPLVEPVLASIGREQTAHSSSATLCLGNILTAPPPVKGTTLGLHGLAQSLGSMLSNFASIDAAVVPASSVLAPIISAD